MKGKNKQLYEIRKEIQREIKRYMGSNPSEEEIDKAQASYYLVKDALKKVRK
ncbi:MAG: hypothetical protein ACE5KT_00325 [Methanosarcinales archaeon]